MEHRTGLFLEDPVFINYIGQGKWKMWEGKSGYWRSWQGSRIVGNIKPNPREKLTLPEEYLT